MDGLLGFLTPDQQKMAQQQALTQGLLGLGSALLQSSTGAPGQPRPRLGQVLGQALPAGLQGYQGGIDQALQQILTGQKMQDMQRQRQQQQQEAQRQEAQRQALESYISSLPMEEQNRFRAFPTQAAEAMFREPKGTYRPLSSDEVQRMTGYTPREGEAFQLSPQGKVESIVRPTAPGPTNVFNLGEARQAMFKEVDIPIVKSYADAATSSGEFARTSESINRLLKGKGGGEIVKIGTDLAKNLGIESNQVTANDLANSLVVQLAPRMRAPNSGSTSDIEFKSYISATPSLGNSEKGREIMSKYASAFAERNAKLADYARKLASEDKLTFEAMRDYDNKLGPVLKKDFYDLVQSPAGRPTSSGGVVDFRTSVRGGR